MEIPMTEIVHVHDGEHYTPKDIIEILCDAEYQEAPMTDWEIDFISKLMPHWEYITDGRCEKLVEIFKERWIDKREPYTG